jgi:stearoyl-CoA desaturase (delta-9 desaturase)
MGIELLEPTQTEARSRRRPKPEAAEGFEGRADGRSLLRDSLSYRPLEWSRIDWLTALWIGLMHAGCLAAPFFFTWSGLAVAAALYWVTGTIGICLFYHRYLSHRSFRLARPIEALGHLCGCLALQGGPLVWSATHRVHHARSDKEGDPHSPRDGKWWSHILWLFVDRTDERGEAFLDRVVPDLKRDPMAVFFQRTFFLWTVTLGILLFALGGWSWLLWGICVRMVVTYHATWFVNSATHLWGYRNYETTDDSKNLWWVAAITGGEGWHNNHHAYPRIARAGHKWWEIDTTYGVIWLLKKTGLAWDVNDRLPDTTRRNAAKPVAAG